MPRYLIAITVALCSTFAISDPAAAEIVSVSGVGYTLSVNDSGRVAVLEISESDYLRATSDGLSDVNMRSLTKKIYNHFADDFDFLMFINDEEQLTSGFPYRGMSYLVSNDVRGIGRRITNRASLYGSDGTLQSAIHLPTYTSLGAGPSLREIARRWANDLLPTDVSGYWGFSSVGGQLGGWANGTLYFEPSVGYFATNVAGNRWRSDGNRRNDIPFAPLELYAMGLLTASAVPDIQIARNPVFNALGGLETSGFDTWDIDRIIDLNGRRRPSVTASQKAFRCAVVVLTQRGDFPTDSRMEFYDSEVEAFSRNGSGGSASLNFYEATSGRATIQMDGLREYLDPPGGGLIEIVDFTHTGSDIHIKVRANLGTRYQIEQSTDLRNWSPLGPRRTNDETIQRLTLAGLFQPAVARYIRLRHTP